MFVVSESLSVNIKTLRVNDNGLTVAVFKQLPIQHERNGSWLWGIVHYRINDNLPYLWLVHSFRDRLYKRGISEKRDRPIFEMGEIQSLKNDIESKKARADNGSDKSSLDQFNREIASLTEALKEAEESENRRFKKAMKDYNQENAYLRDLPQLFIAVCCRCNDAPAP